MHRNTHCMSNYPVRREYGAWPSPVRIPLSSASLACAPFDLLQLRSSKGWHPDFHPKIDILVLDARHCLPYACARAPDPASMTGTYRFPVLVHLPQPGPRDRDGAVSRSHPWAPPNSLADRRIGLGTVAQYCRSNHRSPQSDPAVAAGIGHLAGT